MTNVGVKELVNAISVVLDEFTRDEAEIKADADNLRRGEAALSTPA